LSPNRDRLSCGCSTLQSFYLSFTSTRMGWVRPSCPWATWAGLQGFRKTETSDITCVTSEILSWASAPLQSAPEQRAAAIEALTQGQDSTAPPLRFGPLQRFPTQPLRLWCLGFASPKTPGAFRFSQPLDAFTAMPRLLTTISGQIRSWGLPFRALLLSRSRTLSPAPVPSCRCFSAVNHYNTISPQAKTQP
jgi:hypothetical protein